MKKSSNTPDVRGAQEPPQLFFKHGSRYKEASTVEIIATAVLHLQRVGESKAALDLTLTLPRIGYRAATDDVILAD